MKQLIAFGILLITLGCTSHHKDSDMNNHSHHQGHPQGADQHGHHSRTGAELIVATDPTDAVAGHPVMLKLMIHAADGTMVSDFEETDGGKVHLVIVRDGLDHFAHLHPAVDAMGNLTVTHTFPVGGKYRLFADYAPVGGGHATATGALAVRGQSAPAPAAIPNAPVEVESDGLLAIISASPLRAGSPARVTFALKDGVGRSAALEKYLGELGHLMFVGVASGEYVHVHPLGGEADQGRVEFEAHFSKPGLYKGWGQFQHEGRVRIVPFVLRVEPRDYAE